MAAERDEQAIAFRLQKRKNPKYLEPASQATASFRSHIATSAARRRNHNRGKAQIGSSNPRSYIGCLRWSAFDIGNEGNLRACSHCS